MVGWLNDFYFNSELNPYSLHRLAFWIVGVVPTFIWQIFLHFNRFVADVRIHMFFVTKIKYVSHSVSNCHEVVCTLKLLKRHASVSSFFFFLLFGLN